MYVPDCFHLLAFEKIVPPSSSNQENMELGWVQLPSLDDRFGWHATLAIHYGLQDPLQCTYCLHHVSDLALAESFFSSKCKQTPNYRTKFQVRIKVWNKANHACKEHGLTH